MFSCRKFYILATDCWMGRMANYLPLSATVTIALLFLSLVCIDFIFRDSGCMLCLKLGLL